MLALCGWCQLVAFLGTQRFLVFILAGFYYVSWQQGGQAVLGPTEQLKGVIFWCVVSARGHWTLCFWAHKAAEHMVAEACGRGYSLYGA